MKFSTHSAHPYLLAAMVSLVHVKHHTSSNKRLKMVYSCL